MAVPGINCMRPIAPFGEIASHLKFDSAAMMLLINAAGTRCFSAADRISALVSTGFLPRTPFCSAEKGSKVGAEGLEKLPFRNASPKSGHAGKPRVSEEMVRRKANAQTHPVQARNRPNIASFIGCLEFGFWLLKNYDEALALSVQQDGRVYG